MKTLKHVFEKLSAYVLPKEVDFFGNLMRQSKSTQEILELFYDVYIEHKESQEALIKKMDQSDALRKQHLLQLSKVLITPVDKEAISKAYSDINWIALSVRHLNVETANLERVHFKKHKELFNNLRLQMKELTKCFQLVKEKKFSQIVTVIETLIKMDNDLIQEYSFQLDKLFESDSFKLILRQQEILMQIKEVSKRIHICANTLEDIVFRLT